MVDSKDEKLSVDDIAVLVFTSALYLHERALSVHNTWLRNFKKGYLIGGYYYDPKLKMIALGEDVGEDYQSATKKQFLGLIRLLDLFPEAKWFYITGCDAYVFADNLVQLLEPFDPARDYFIGGHCGEVYINNEKLIYPGGGPGFALSNALAHKIRNRIPAFVEEWERTQTTLKPACDVALAYLLKRDFDIHVTYREGFYYGHPYDYPRNTYKDGEGNDINKEVIDHPIVFHTLSIREMYILHKKGWLWPRTYMDRAFDKLSLFLSRKLKTKRIVNFMAICIYGIGIYKKS
jgi:hypothetical protein